MDSRGNPAARAPHAARSPRHEVAAVVAAWEDDPGDPAQRPRRRPITLDAPIGARPPLPFRVAGPTPAARRYRPGTPGFRFFAAASALRRAADAWGAVVPPSTRWHVGDVLPVVLDDGVDLNAFYTRGTFGDAPGLHFFHARVAGRSCFSGESPDVACHELGHAVLDAIRPQLFHAQAIEVAAFHESFGDVSSLVSALALPSFRRAVVAETAGIPSRSSRLSRLAEQLAAAIRARRPDAVDPDCLRNAANSFFYRRPETLPPMAPASLLSAEPHSFSRVFTAAFLEILSGVFRLTADAPREDDLAEAARTAARLLVAGVRAAPIGPSYYAQVAAAMVRAGDRAPFGGRYRDVLKSAFVRRGILSLGEATTPTPAPKRGSGDSTRRATTPVDASTPPLIEIATADFGLRSRTLHVQAAGAPDAVPGARAAAECFTAHLFLRGRVQVARHADPARALVHSFAAKTHVLVEEDGQLVLRRARFDCGFEPDA